MHTLVRTIMATVAGFALLFAACGGGDGDANSNTDAPGDPEAFPVTITHKYGETEITQLPRRVVSVGYSEQDVILALGVKPIAIRYWYGDYPFQVWPWAQDELGDAEPVVLAQGAELDFEQIAALNPDLILGITSGMTRDEYDLLSRIAPTVPQPGEFVDYGVPWRDETRIIGRALGLSEQAEELITSVEARYAAVRAAHPEFAGKTAAVAFNFNNLPGAYSSADARSAILMELGFVIPATYDELAGDAFYVSFSEEQMNLLDVDVLVWLSSTEAGMQAIKTLPLRSSLQAVSEGRELFVNPLLGGAFSFGSPLSIPFLLEEMVPMLAAAVDGDPTTEVPN